MPPSKEELAALYISAQNGHHLVVKRLVEKEVDRMAAADNGQTPLHLAALKGYLGIEEQLLSAGANPNLQSEMKQTALIAALCDSWTDIAQLLLSSGADHLLFDGYGRTCVDWALDRHRTRLLSWL
jgi:ankyrin repeat protein